MSPMRASMPGGPFHTLPLAMSAKVCRRDSVVMAEQRSTRVTTSAASEKAASAAWSVAFAATQRWMPASSADAPSYTCFALSGIRPGMPPKPPGPSKSWRIVCRIRSTDAYSMRGSWSTMKRRRGDASSASSSRVSQTIDFHAATDWRILERHSSTYARTTASHWSAGMQWRVSAAYTVTRASGTVTVRLAATARSRREEEDTVVSSASNEATSRPSPSPARSKLATAVFREARYEV
mmetsp:Transcript_3912/g.12450  ORF Transcript_3912/g.12450 Transcript_3912/m.12450 type:complete len:237 (-) Transcript_3912:607-1317(-)